MEKLCKDCNKKERIRYATELSSYCKECSKKRCNRWYKKNKKEKIKKTLIWLKNTNYASEKILNQRIIRRIKSHTRKKYPLKNKICQECKINPATEHHHTTIPITIDDFIYICHNCHTKSHKSF